MPVPSVLGAVRLEGTPRRIAVDSPNNYVYVIYFDSRIVTVLNGTSLEVRSRIDLGPGKSPQDIDFMPVEVEGRVVPRIYVLNDDQTVSVINGENFGVSASIDLPKSNAVGNLRTNPREGQVYVTLPALNQIAVIDGSEDHNQIRETFAATGLGPGGLAVDPLRNDIYVTSCESGSVRMYDVTTLQLTNTIPITAAGCPIRVAVASVFDPKLWNIYVLTTSPDLVVIRGTDKRAASTFQLGFFDGTIAVNPGTSHVFVADTSGENLAVLMPTPTATLNAIETIRVGMNPVSIGVNLRRNVIYVASTGNRTLTAIMDSADPPAAAPGRYAVAGTLVLAPATLATTNTPHLLQTPAGTFRLWPANLAIMLDLAHRAVWSPQAVVAGMLLDSVNRVILVDSVAHSGLLAGR